MNERRTGVPRWAPLLALFWSLRLVAQAVDPDEESALAALLNQGTQLATKTRMNHDYVPGMVTVLQGEDLEGLGIRTVWEALALVPGVQIVRDGTGSALVLVRGVNFIFNSGNIKILVDSIGMNQESAGISSSILLMPIEEVERIEFMRGPGSAIHGDFAYLGLVNIVTRREGRRVFASAETDSTNAGGHLSFASPDGEHKVSLGLSGSWYRDVDRRGPGNAEQKKGFGRLFWGYRGLSVTAEALGANHRAAPEQGGARFTERRLAAEVRYGRDLTPALRAEVYGNLLRSDDAVGTRAYDGLTLQGGLEVRWTAPRGHNLLLAASYSHTDIDHAANIRPPLFFVDLRNLSRHGASVVVQDQWSVTETLTLTVGARLDDLSDVGTVVSPRFALVWRLGERHTIKGQYAEGFRSPAFFELYFHNVVETDLLTETIDTTEVSYILKHPKSVGRVTLFHANLRDMLQPPNSSALDFSNSGSVRTQGVELEWAQELGRLARVSANLSWVDPEDRRSTRDVAAASHWLWNLSLVAEPLRWLRLAARWNHVGTRGGIQGTIETDGYDTVDLTASGLDLAGGLTVRCGIKNLFDDGVVYMAVLPPPLPSLQIPYGGRTAWIQLAYAF